MKRLRKAALLLVVARSQKREICQTRFVQRYDMGEIGEHDGVEGKAALSGFVHYSCYCNLVQRSCIATATTGNTLTSSPIPAYAGGIRTSTKAPAASRIAKRL